jgi:hypothetical protein
MKSPYVLRQKAIRLRAEIRSVTDPVVVRLANSVARTYEDMADQQERAHRGNVSDAVVGLFEN